MEEEKVFNISLIEETDKDGNVKHSLSSDEFEGTELSKYIGPLHDCPEDACIGRDLIDGNHLIAAFRLGYELGTKNYKINVSIKKIITKYVN